MFLPATTRPPIPYGAGQRPRLLIVDQDPTVRVHFKSLLETTILDAWTSSVAVCELTSVTRPRGPSLSRVVGEPATTATAADRRAVNLHDGRQP